MFRLRFAALAAAAMFVTASAFATTYAVGTCLPNLISYPTISKAVSSVPSGSTIEVCPGNYPEQVVITQPLTLEGVPGASSEAAIVIPPGGLTQTVMGPSIVSVPVAFQVLVQSTGQVNIENMAFDGNGANNLTGLVAGIVYLDSSGKAEHLSVRNEAGNASGSGFLAFTSAPAPQTVTVESSVFRGFAGFGVLATSGGGTVTANVNSNTIHGIGGSSVGLCYYAASGTAQFNQITGDFNEVVITYSHVVATQNNVSAVNAPQNSPFTIDASSVSITSNMIDAGGNYAFALGGPSSNSIIQHNTIGNSLAGAYGCNGMFLDGPASGFNVTSNTIIDAEVGVQMPSTNTTAPNNYYATAAATLPCT